jgi:hypothetical protein
MRRPEPEPRDPPWDDLYRQWHDAREAREAEQVRATADAALRRVRDLQSDDFTWLMDALEDTDKRWFVAGLFAEHALPRRLFEPMLAAALRDCDATEVKHLVRPCSKTFGTPRVVEWFRRAKELGLASTESIQKAEYWAGKLK